MQADPPQKQLAEIALGEPIEEWIAVRRRAKKSWRTIALELHIATAGRASLTSEAVRRWNPDAGKDIVEATA